MHVAAEDAAAAPLTRLKGVGPRLAERLARLGLHTVQDVLFHLPTRYQDRTRVVPVATLRPGDQAVVQGEVRAAQVRFGRRRMLLVRIEDGSGLLTLRFFHFSAAQQAALAPGAVLRCFGEVRGALGALEMVHPEYRRVAAEEAAPVEEHLTPVYPATEGLGQPALRNLAAEALRFGGGPEHSLHEWLPPALRAQFRLPALGEAVRFLHRPPPDVSQEALEEGAHPAQQRLAFEELLAHHLSLRALRDRVQRRRAAPFGAPGACARAYEAGLPFPLTGAQRRVIAEIETDLGRGVPMQRLVQGDVGSGKTVVAAAALARAVDAGWQGALMAPTELLAEQHARNLRAWFEPLGVPVAWLAGRARARARNAALAAIAEGHAPLAVGTHALFQEGVDFARLGLVVIDEQHRFGVHQRLALREKGAREGLHPHQLIMTATPIPRTLAMTAYADLDVSVIDELPPGRTPVETVVIPDTRREDVVARVRAACAAGRQAYWVCTLIEESDALQAQAAEATAALLTEALPELRVGLVHGRLKSADKEAVMGAFKRGEIGLLVATTVIEVGVDVPNASLMIIENAERLGLAQLHQLRGRVGRGAAASVCVLMYHGPLSALARERLSTLRETGDGFAIAQRDLELRGPGEVLGTRQTGLLQLRVARLERDRALLERVPAAAQVLRRDHPGHVPPLVRRWVPGAVYADV